MRKNVTIYLRTKFLLTNPALFLSSEAEILTKHLYSGHLVAYLSVNMLAAEVFHVFPPTATTQNSMDRQTWEQEHHGDIKLCIL